VPELDQPVSGSCEETVEQQAHLTGFLLDHITAPLAGTAYLRGVLPAPDAVRIVTGPADAVVPGALTAYELPMSDEDDEPVTAPLVLGWIRTLLAGPPLPADATVMGMPLVKADTIELTPAAPGASDRTLRVLRTLSRPVTDEIPSPALCGFLCTGADSMRLYLAAEQSDSLTAADVLLTGALTALLAALPALIGETERWTDDPHDPHCTRTVDLTAW
jgi:hypothetical protein